MHKTFGDCPLSLFVLLIDVFLDGGINDRGANAAAASGFQIVLLAATATFAAMALRRMMIVSLEAGL